MSLSSLGLKQQARYLWLFQLQTQLGLWVTAVADPSPPQPPTCGVSTVRHAEERGHLQRPGSESQVPGRNLELYVPSDITVGSQSNEFGPGGPPGSFTHPTCEGLRLKLEAAIGFP